MKITSYDLQDLWHYAEAITKGGKTDSCFATSSLLGRLQLITDARNLIERIPYEIVFNTALDEVHGRLYADYPRTVEDVEKLGQELLDLVDEECARQGIDGRSGEPIVKDFLRGFAASSGVTSREAAEGWAEFSRQLSDAERSLAEAGGYDSGWREGGLFAELY